MPYAPSWKPSSRERTSFLFYSFTPQSPTCSPTNVGLASFFLILSPRSELPSTYLSHFGLLKFVPDLFPLKEKFHLRTTLFPVLLFEIRIRTTRFPRFLQPRH